jgi:iron complex transport system substrate-binding protein
LPFADSHWSDALGRRWRGSPESEDLPVALLIEPLAEGGFVHHRLFVAVSTALAALALALGASAAGTRTQAFPHRIVSISPTATESLFAIGAGAQVVAVDSQSDYPKNAPITKLAAFTPNIEAIATYKPDLVVLSYDPGGVVASLQKLNIRVLMQPAAADLKQAYAEILQLGKITGHRVKAKALVASMQQQIAKVVAAAPHDPSLSVFHELEPDLYSATSSTFIGKIYALFGLKNIADAADSGGSGYPQLSNEYIVAASPSIIVLADSVCCGASPQSVSGRPGWNTISAVRNHAIVKINDSIASRWGPRIVNFVRAVAAALRVAAR